MTSRKHLSMIRRIAIALTFFGTLLLDVAPATTVCLQLPSARESQAGIEPPQPKVDLRMMVCHTSMSLLSHDVHVLFLEDALVH